jgi:hypothetical protein
MIKSIPINSQHIMDPKFIFILFFVEVGSLIFNILHVAASELHVYNAYNEVPFIYHTSSKPYSCFSSINYCVYEDKQLRFLKLLDLIFISIIVICYGSLFTIIILKWENIKISASLKITWYAGVQLLALLILALHTLLIIILVERDTENTNQCNKQNRLVRFENVFNYIVLTILEVAYIGFHLINRQLLPVHTSLQEFEYTDQTLEHRRLPSLENDQRVIEFWN